MNRIEERLADALAAGATAIRQESLRPLRPPGHVPSPRWRLTDHRWIAPIAAATAVAIIATVMAGITPRARTASAWHDWPKFYVWYTRDLDGHQLEVVSTATGAAVGRVPDPPNAHGYVWFGAENRFRSYVAMPTSCLRCATPLYRFRITATGHVADMTALHGIALPHSISGIPARFELSPDGSKIAYRFSVPSAGSAGIVVTSLRSGRATIWQTRATIKGRTLLIGPPSWTGDSRRVAFGELWCTVRTPTSPAECGSLIMRELNPARPGGDLNTRSAALYAEPLDHLASWPWISPTNRFIVQLDYTGSHVNGSTDAGALLTSVEPATGRRSVLYRWQIAGNYTLGGFAGMAVVLFANGPHWPSIIGWIGQSGRFQPVPIG